MALAANRPLSGNNVAPGCGYHIPFDVDLLCAKLEAWRLQQETEQWRCKHRYFGGNVGVTSADTQQRTIPLNAGNIEGSWHDGRERVEGDGRRPQSNATFDRRSMAFMNIENLAELRQDSDGYLIGPKAVSKRRSKTLSFHVKKPPPTHKPASAWDNWDAQERQSLDDESLESFEKPPLTKGLRSRSLLNLHQLLKKDKVEAQVQEVDIVLDEKSEDLRPTTDVDGLNHSRQKSLPVDLSTASTRSALQKEGKERKRRTFMGLFKKS